MSKYSPSPQRLLVAVHDVSPRFENEIEVLLELLAQQALNRRVAMLAIPDHWDSAPILRGSPFASKLRGWSDSGIEIFVHGWSHRDEMVHAGGIAAFKARHMTAGEGEFLGLNRADCVERMAAGKALIEDIIGRPAAGFIAPAWLYGAGALDALATSGFALAEDHFKVWRADTSQVLSSGPVITWASRSRARILSSLLAVPVLMHASRFLPTVRVAVHPGDVHVPALRRSIDATLGHLRQFRAPSRYADLLG